MTKFKSQALQIMRIKYWNASGSGNPPLLITAFWLFHKQATRTKHFEGEWMNQMCCLKIKSLYPIFFPYIFNIPEEMAKKVHTDTLLVFMVQGEVCLVLEKIIEKKL